MEKIESIWTPEDPYVEDFALARDIAGSNYSSLISTPRSVHFCLKPTEDGTAELATLPPPIELTKQVHILPGRLTLHLYESKVAERWSGVYQGDPLSIRTGTRIRTLALDYADKHGYDIVILDTSPSLGALNRNILSLADGFIIPCSPDLFSMYGVRNIGNALRTWKKQFQSIFHFLSDAKRDQFPSEFVKLLGYTIYNAKRYSGYLNDLDLATANYHYAEKIPETIKQYIDNSDILGLVDGFVDSSIGDNAVIHSHNTFPSMSQKYNLPMWKLPQCDRLEPEDRSTIAGNQARYLETRSSYRTFAKDFLERVEALHE